MIELKIEGMSCNHCAMAVEKALSDVDGVRSVVVDLSGGRATVEGAAPVETLVAAVTAEGYQAAPATSA